MPDSVPQHVAIIMDGNGRWAKQRGLPLIAGHKAGAAVARTIVKHAYEKGVRSLTLYTFSAENWRRDMAWLNDFMTLLRWYFNSQIEDLMKNGVKICILGDMTQFPSDIQALMKNVELRTKDNTNITVFLAIGHSGRQDITQAVRRISTLAQQGELNTEDIDESYFASHLQAACAPDPDLMIRTSGEMRISNFLLWNIAYTELVFVQKFWPDFAPDDFDQALEEFSGRQRRYGA